MKKSAEMVLAHYQHLLKKEFTADPSDGRGEIAKHYADFAVTYRDGERRIYAVRSATKTAEK